MEKKQKITNVFSGPLLKQTIKTNRVLMIVVLLIMCMMSNVVNFAMSIMGESQTSESTQEAQKDFYSYLYVLASYNDMAGTELSYEDYKDTEDKSLYQNVFQLMNQEADMNFSTEGFEAAFQELEDSTVPVETYVRQFEYTYELGDLKGCFTGEDLDIEDMMHTMLETMGISSDLIETIPLEAGDFVGCDSCFLCGRSPEIPEKRFAIIILR